MVKVKGVIRPMETRELEAEGEDYAAAREALLAQVPEGWQVLSVMTAR
ncbi:MULTISPECIES: hypothetical protein [Paenarthrobacter]|uniref:Uncharacterized protein n=1 Tax=Paenarthrobacter aurescens (strain TC1) TaxID=290340 RepID=A1RCK4_PAEAT|nr:MULTISPECIES: hypothetical protein [Paenarthrobacter]ABM10460.1 hypothetical protein AAur_pTC10092 [Paenarthrobacter aurescens TC1]MCY0975564.1 hypothetical protein [Paenarthrobacter ureafaciens]